MRRQLGSIMEVAFGIGCIVLLALALTRWDRYAGTTKALFISLAASGAVGAARGIRAIAGKHPRTAHRREIDP